MKQITERIVAGKPALSALGEMVDELETCIAELLRELESSRRVEPREIEGEVTPEIVKRVINAMLYYLREHADAATKQPFIEILRSLIHCVEIGPSPDGRGAELTVYGRIVGILATMDAVRAMEAEYRTLREYE